MSRRIDEKFDSPSAEVVDDATFLRRVFLDLVGTIPSVSQARDFLHDDDSEKRDRLVRRLLVDPRSSAHWSRVYRRIMIPNGSPGMAFAPQFEVWLKRQFAEKTPYDELARELVTAQGAVAPMRFRPDQPVTEGSPVAFYRAVGSTPDSMASSVSRVFLGVRIGCAKCHHHPFAPWKQEDFWGMAAFFAGANLAGQPNMPAVDQKVRTIRMPEGGKEFTVRLLWSETPAQIPDDELPRKFLADWLVSKDNPNFAATAVNRVWQQLCGQGLYPQVDDLDLASAQQRALLDELAAEFVRADFDLHWLIAGICLSRAYQRPSETPESSEKEAEVTWHRPLKALSPEQAFDALEQALMLPIGRNDQSPRYNSQMAAFLQRLNESTGNSPDEFTAGIPQALLIMNGVLVSSATDLDESRTLRAVVEAPFLDAAAKVETLYLAALTRKPEPAESEKMLSHIERQPDSERKRRAYADIFWALLNSPEFVLSR